MQKKIEERLKRLRGPKSMHVLRHRTKCGWEKDNNTKRHEYESDLRSNEHYLSCCENKAWKKNSGLREILTHELCDTGAVLCRETTIDE